MSRNNSDDKAIERIIHLMRTDDSVAAPLDAVKWAKNIFRTRAAEPKKSVLEKVSAILRMDLPPDKAAFGERSASASQIRQMLFQAGDASIDLRIKREKDVFSLRGQILGEDFANGTIEFGDFKSEINELGEFELAKIPGGKYDVHLREGDREIVVENLQFD